MLVQQEDGLPRRVVVQPHKGVLVGEPSPVHALVRPVEAPDLLVRDLPQLQVLEDVAAGADRETQVLVPVPPRVPLLQLLGLGEEGLAQPVRVVQVQVAAAVPAAVRALLLAVQVGPVVAGQGRVVGLKVPEQRAAAHRRLQHAVDLRPPGELVLLLKVRHADVAELRLDGLDLHRVVRAPEHDLLPGRQVHQFQRGAFGLPVLRHAQLADSPDVLRVHRVAQRGRHLAQHQGVHVPVLHDQPHHRQRSPRGLQAAAAAAGLEVGVAVLQRVHADLPEVGGDVRQIVGPHDREGPDLFPVLGSVFLRFGAFQQFLPLSHRGDVAGRRAAEDRRRHGRVVAQVLPADAELPQPFLQFFVADFRARDLLRQLRQRPVPGLRHGLHLRSKSFDGFIL